MGNTAIDMLGQHQQNLRDIGKALAEKRVEKGLTVENIAEATNVRMFFLTCMEEGHFEKLPGGIYTTGLAKLYMSWLGFNDEQCQTWIQTIDTHPGEDETTHSETFEQPIAKMSFPLWGGGIVVLLGLFVFWMWHFEKSNDEVTVLMEQTPVEEKEEITHQEPAAVALALHARGTTWIKITEGENNNIVHTQLLKKGSTIDLTPYIGKNLTVGDGRQVVAYKAGVEVGPLSDASDDDSPTLIENRLIQADD